MAFDVYADIQKKFVDILTNFGGTLTNRQAELILQRLDHNYLEGLACYTPHRYLRGLSDAGRLTIDNNEKLVNAGHHVLGGFDKKKSDIIYCLLDLLENPEDILSVRYNRNCDFWDFIKDGKRQCLVSFNADNVDQRIPFLITQHENEIAQMPVKATKLRPFYYFLVEENKNSEYVDLAFDKAADLEITVPCCLIKCFGGGKETAPKFEYYTSNIDE